MWATSVIFKKLVPVNSRQLGKNSPYLVTLIKLHAQVNFLQFVVTTQHGQFKCFAELLHASLHAATKWHYTVLQSRL
jgi:hypothetical protein